MRALLSLAVFARRKASGEAGSKASGKECLGFVVVLAEFARRKACNKLTRFTSLLVALLVYY